MYPFPRRPHEEVLQNEILPANPTPENFFKLAMGPNATPSPKVHDIEMD